MRVHFVDREAAGTLPNAGVFANEVNDRQFIRGIRTGSILIMMDGVLDDETYLRGRQVAIRCLLAAGIRGNSELSSTQEP